MDEWEKAIAVLPQDMQEELKAVSVPLRQCVAEVRFRVGMPMLLTGAEACVFVGRRTYTAQDLHRLFCHLCAHSVYAHQTELRCGFVAAANGCRAGIAGQAVVENGQVVSVRDVTSVCLRLPREHRGCARPLVERLYCDGRLQSLLICGSPASGKTTLLRDVIRALACDRRRPTQLAVVDERGELTATFESARPFDVLGGFPKAIGIEQALRTLSPEGIVFDELGGSEDIEAVLRCVHSGVATIGSVHAESISALHSRPLLRQLLTAGAWDLIAVMAGRTAPGTVAAVLSAEEILP